MGMREISLGSEYKLQENLALSVRGVYKHLLWAIEDMGILLPDGEHYFTSNPGGPFIKAKYALARANGLVPASAPDLPKAAREYWALNVALDKRFANNWMGGVSLTLSRLTGNYNGLASGDEYGRTQPNIERYFDLWYLPRTLTMAANNGLLPGDRPIYFKLYGSYTFPFGLTAGFVLNAMSGIPTSTELEANSGWLPYGRNDLGRTPFTWFTNLYVAYEIKLGRTRFQINCNVDNLFDISTAQRIYGLIFQSPSAIPEDVLATGTANPYDYGPIADPQYKKKMNFYGPIALRLGAQFSF
jgi:hypothetical protein